MSRHRTGDPEDLTPFGQEEADLLMALLGRLASSSSAMALDPATRIALVAMSQFLVKNPPNYVARQSEVSVLDMQAHHVTKHVHKIDQYEAHLAEEESELAVKLSEVQRARATVFFLSLTYHSTSSTRHHLSLTSLSRTHPPLPCFTSFC
ncbi:hypothetical protein V5O48_014749 [Marasmius crinis-equi]|uniref:Uncharacterized protein n=1 Tax=Marasmius crinis-equi TaxID=585013 RepID=A0ABR3EWF9_9AGAR